LVKSVGAAAQVQPREVARAGGSHIEAAVPSRSHPIPERIRGRDEAASRLVGVRALHVPSSRGTPSCGSRNERTHAMNAIQLLKDDHKKVRGLLAELEATTPRGIKTRTELLARIAKEIEVHSAIEEEIFYPAFKAAAQKGDDDKMYFEALEEHRAAGDLVLPDLLATDPGSDCFGGRAKVLKELIEHHAGDEEKEMFPRARKLLSAADLNELGARMEQRKQVLMAAGGKPKSATGKLLEAVVDAIAPEALSEAKVPRRSPPRKSANGATNGRSGARAG
jgi:hemerythrin superfamily protein